MCLIILQHFDYCSVMWECTGKVLSVMLEKLENWESHIITGSDLDLGSSQILCDLNWPNLVIDDQISPPNMFHKTSSSQTPVTHIISVDLDINNFIPRPNEKPSKRALLTKELSCGIVHHLKLSKL